MSLQQDGGLKENVIKPLVLIILDGWGINPETEGNAIASANTPVMDYLIKNYPNTVLDASGAAVGLPLDADGNPEMGNSEVGHLNLGGGLVVRQDVTIINEGISDKTFFSNSVLKDISDHLKNNPGSSLHIQGLISNAVIHSSMDHLLALLTFAKDEGLDNVYIDAITDGRDSATESSLQWIKNLLKEMDSIGIGEIATIVGRSFAMDRDNDWQMIEQAYNLYTQGIAVNREKDVLTALRKSHQEGLTDEFIKPTVIIGDNGEPLATIKDNDVVIFFNFRADRARQITRAFMDDNFKGFKREIQTKVKWVCMTQYDETFSSFDNLSVMFPPKKLPNTLSEVLSKNKRSQLHIAETQKFAHVTFFFNGREENPFKGEKRIIIPSLKGITFDKAPAMSAFKVTKKLIEEMSKYDVSIINIANADMVGHTGNLKATIEAIEVVDSCLGKIIKELEKQGGIALVTADHGNAEGMGTEDKPITKHSTNPVPFILVNYSNLLGNPLLRPGGILADVAPTMLQILEIKQPIEMTGKSLIVIDNDCKRDESDGGTPTRILVSAANALIFWAGGFSTFVNNYDPGVELTAFKSLSGAKGLSAEQVVSQNFRLTGVFGGYKVKGLHLGEKVTINNLEIDTLIIPESEDLNRPEQVILYFGPETVWAEVLKALEGKIDVAVEYGPGKEAGGKFQPARIKSFIEQGLPVVCASPVNKEGIKEMLVGLGYDSDKAFKESLYAANRDIVDESVLVVDTLSCTSNAMVGIIWALQEAIGIDTGTGLTIHAATPQMLGPWAKWLGNEGKRKILETDGGEKDKVDAIPFSLFAKSKLNKGGTVHLIVFTIFGLILTLFSLYSYLMINRLPLNWDTLIMGMFIIITYLFGLIPYISMKRNEKKVKEENREDYNRSLVVKKVQKEILK
ncbi:MAG: 2,3-bisphosphoglycerate-independent phosphoglycerate mutase, partial [Candidatus Omnitrophica bacterium]|nr:2,3-bisphosphoglycerate-independent phosphoglycerate mutase [Candidatus Omnitrophota bacterium]